MPEAVHVSLKHCWKVCAGQDLQKVRRGTEATLLGYDRFDRVQSLGPFTGMPRIRL